MQGKFAIFVDHGVARIVSALIADDNIIFLCDQVDHAALALIAPVHAYDRAVCHCCFLHFINHERCGIPHRSMAIIPRFAYKRTY